MTVYFSMQIYKPFGPGLQAEEVSPPEIGTVQMALRGWPDYYTLVATTTITADTLEEAVLDLDAKVRAGLDRDGLLLPWYSGGMVSVHDRTHANEPLAVGDVLVIGTGVCCNRYYVESMELDEDGDEALGLVLGSLPIGDGRVAATSSEFSEHLAETQREAERMEMVDIDNLVERAAVTDSEAVVSVTLEAATQLVAAVRARSAANPQAIAGWERGAVVQQLDLLSTMVGGFDNLPNLDRQNIQRLVQYLAHLAGVENDLLTLHAARSEPPVYESAEDVPRELDMPLSTES